MRTLFRPALLLLALTAAASGNAAAPRGLGNLLLQANARLPGPPRPLSLDFGGLRLPISPPPRAALPLQADKWRALGARLSAGAAPAVAAAESAADPVLPALSWAQASLGVEQALEQLSVAQIEQAGDERLDSIVADISVRLQKMSLARSPGVRESDGVLVPVGAGPGRARRFKVFSADGLALERRKVPASLAGIYGEIRGGGVRKTAADPLEGALRDSGVELWTVRHGETESNRAALLAGGGTDAPLTSAPNFKGLTGTAQAAAAARALYAAFGGDSWAGEVLAGRAEPVVILASPLRRARQTGAAFKALLDERRKALAAGGRPLYEFHLSRSLREMAYGLMEGLPLEAAKRTSIWGPWATAPAGAGRDFLDRFPRGESRFDVMMRQRNLFKRVLAAFPGRRIVTFAHYETVIAQQAVLGLLNLRPSDGSLQAAPIENARPTMLLGR